MDRFARVLVGPKKERKASRISDRSYDSSNPELSMKPYSSQGGSPQVTLLSSRVQK